VRAYPIVYYSKRARNTMINYSKTLPAVMLWIGEKKRELEGDDDHVEDAYR
jgi:hypothetical protein